MRLPQLRLARPALDLRPDAPFVLDVTDEPGAAALATDSAPAVHKSPADISPQAIAIVEGLHPSEAPQIAAASEQPGRAGQQAAPAAEDLAQAVASALTAQWRALGLRSTLRGLDIETAAGRARAILDAHPAEAERLLALPAELMRANPGWSARWHKGALAIALPRDLGDGPGGPHLVPTIRHGRGGRVTRFVPLGQLGDADDGIPGLGLYGAHALEMLHTCLVSLIYTRPPEALALAVLDGGKTAPLYAGTPHAVRPPGSARSTVATLDRALRRGWARGAVRPLVLAVVEPDEALLRDLAALVGRLRHRGAAPLHLLLAQEHLLPAGRELYAALPAVISGCGRGDPCLLPDARAWPARKAARLAAPGLHIGGLPCVLDDLAARAALTNLTPVAGVLPPVLWDAPALRHAAAAAPPLQPPEVEADEMNELARRLSRALDGLPSTEDEAMESAGGAEDTPWPHGPGQMRPADVAALVDRLLSDPAVVAANPPGITRRRLAALLPPAGRAYAGALMGWLDAAGLLAEPRDETLRWREPRALTVADPEEIAARLREIKPSQ